MTPFVVATFGLRQEWVAKDAADEGRVGTFGVFLAFVLGSALFASASGVLHDADHLTADVHPIDLGRVVACQTVTCTLQRVGHHVDVESHFQLRFCGREGAGF